MHNTRIGSCLILTAAMLVLALLYGCSTTPEGNASDGKRWYAMQNCSACHGPNGNDGKAPNLAKLDMNFGAFVGKLRTTGAPIMPYYPETKVSDKDAADIYAYLQSIQ